MGTNKPTLRKVARTFLLASVSECMHLCICDVKMVPLLCMYAVLAVCLLHDVYSSNVSCDENSLTLFSTVLVVLLIQ